MKSTMRTLFISLPLVLLAACNGGQTQLAQPAPAYISEWQATRLQSEREVHDGRYGVADRLLTDFASKNPATSEAIESTYWRALYKLDPANSAVSPRDAAALLDGYLANGQGTHRQEASSLRRVAGAMEAYASATTTAPVKTETIKVDDKAKDEELKRLADELAKANAELDRIKRRLAQPKP